ncbi:TPA: MBL fold metallo-hydrolase, partial [bacterium]|nr:MBL fold metallo-hydrolase [bacterium]
MFRLCVLASGSSGNCIYFSADGHHWLIDAGISGKEINNRLNILGVGLENIEGVFVTHEHDDHISSLALLGKRHGVELFANLGTAEAIESSLDGKKLQWNIFPNGSRFNVKNIIEVEPFSVPHDAMDPVGFVIYKGTLKIAIVTDIGVATTLVKQRLRGCRIIVMESNHEPKLLNNSKRPWSLKQRISGRHGHFSNEQAAELIAEVADQNLKTIYLAHLSSECNKPQIAFESMRKTLCKLNLADVS